MRINRASSGPKVGVVLRSTRSWMARVGVVALVLCAGVLLGADAAQARVIAPRPVSPRGVLVQGSAVAAGGGRTVVLMAGYLPRPRPHGFSLQARIGDGTRLGRLQHLADHVSDPRVAVGADGTAVAAWTARPRRGTVVLRAAIARAGHDFGRVQTLSQARSMNLGGVGVTATGRAVVAWRPGTTETPVQVAVAEPGRRFATALTLGDSRYYAPAVTVAPNGTTVVAWLDTPSPPLPHPAPPSPSPSPSIARVLAATLTQDATRFGPVTELGKLDSWFSGPEVASGPGGVAVSWRQTGTEKRLISLAAGGAFGPAVTLPPSTYSAEQSDHLALGLPANGTNVALWREVRTRTAEDPTQTFAAVYSSHRPPGGAFSPAKQLSASGSLAGPPTAGALTDRTVAAWVETGAGRPRVRIAVRRVGHAWTALPPLPTPAIDRRTISAAASSRYAVLTWIQHIGPVYQPGGRLYLATYRP